jgi:hypothetical protein
MKAIDKDRESFQVKMSNMFATVKTLGESGDIHKAWGKMGESYTTSGEVRSSTTLGLKKNSIF